jgi:glycosyltransferase involved in cell wall biosynthesis
MNKPESAKRPVRVLINALHAHSGGGITYLFNMLPRLADDTRIDLHLLLHPDQAGLFAPIDPRVTVHKVDFPHAFWWRLVWEQVKLPAYARRLGIDITFSPANFGPLFAPGRVILLRNAVAVGRTERRFFKRLYWLALTGMTAISVLRSHHVIAVSKYAGNALTKGLPQSVQDAVSIVHHGVDPHFSPGPVEPVDPPFILAVGDLYVQKNFETLIEAFAHVTRSHPRLRLKIAGRALDTGYSEQIKNSVNRLGIQEWVEFLGQVDHDELISLYRHCLVFAFPSTVETFGQPLAEAMACGAPIVSSNTAAMPEVVGDAALFCDPTDMRQMADRLLQLIRERPRREELQSKARDRARNFSWDITAQQTADILVATANPALAH